MGRKKWSAAQQRHVLHENYLLWQQTSPQVEEANEGYLGLDFSLTSTGVVLLDNEGELVSHDSIVTAAKDGTTPQRIAKVTDTIKNIMGDKKPKVVGAEAINVGTHINSLLQLARVSGAVYQVINDLGDPIPYMLYCNVSTLKTAATSNVKATKSHMLMEVFANWGVRMETDDEADAFVAAKLAYKADAFFDCYAELAEDTSDLPDLLMDIGKNRCDEFYALLEEKDISKQEADALIGIFTGSRKGGSGMTQLKENDRDFYYKARTRLKKI